MGITHSMSNMSPEERKDYMRALRAKQTAPVGFASNPERARQAQIKSVAVRKARQLINDSGITESDGHEKAEDR